MDRIQLETAFMWRCPNCRNRNFAAAVDRELTEEEEGALIAQYGNLGGEDFELVGAPAIVTCSKCESKYKTYDKEDFETQ
jgi:hypothetical protein